MAKRESGPSTFFSHCANDAGATTHVAQKCPACDVQVLIHTACLRAFCFCVMIGTNALESFNEREHRRASNEEKRLLR